jgi:MoaA/NifB/PqqE/SkfB family radical SAM enzyme
MQPIKIVSTQSSNVLSIRWDPTNVCNYKCRYCFPGSNAGTYRAPNNLDLIIKNFKFLLSQYEKKLAKTKFQIYLAGGEPTLWKDLGIFLEEIKKEHNVYCTLISNGSRTIRWWNDYATTIDNAHLTLHLAEGDVAHIIKVADLLYAAGAKVTVKVLMDPLHWDKGVEYIEKMKTESTHPWFIQVEKVIEQTADRNIPVYTDDQMKYIKRGIKRIPSVYWFWKNRSLLKEELRIWESKATLDTGKVLWARPGTYINNNWNSFENWQCSIGSENIYIGYTGDIKGACNTKLYNLNYYYNILDKQFTEQFNPVASPITCLNSKCWCSPENHISKIKLAP